jgi:mannose-6-phosphate isomerase-like protein (cupin superfamily)
MSAQQPSVRRPRGRRALLLFAGLLTLYLGVGHFLHRVVFPLPAPDPATFPVAGDRYASTREGFASEVTAVTADGWITSRLTIRPGAAGPPRHLHHTFDETFVVEQGVLTLDVGDATRTIRTGDTVRIAAGTPHRPHNPSGDTVVVASDVPVMPQSFAACLQQLYPVLDAKGDGPALLLQMSVIDPICDTHLADVPAPVMRLLSFLVAPIARVVGYRNYYPERAAHPPA